MVRPVSVTVTAALAASAVPDVVMTMEVAPTAPMRVDVILLEETVSMNVLVALKKPDGYVSVMVLPAASAPPALVVNENVAAADVFPATRSDAAIANDVIVT
jgi:hypothetical protein